MEKNQKVSVTDSTLPPGTIVPFVGQHVPEGWLPCDGKALERGDSRFEALFQSIGHDWSKPTDEDQVFRVPDLGHLPLPETNLHWALGYPPQNPRRNRLAEENTGQNSEPIAPFYIIKY